jgi:hypothetical protein
MPSSAPAPRSAFRISVENASRGLLTVLHGLPRLLIPLSIGILFATGVLAPLPIALPALGIVFLVVCWLAYLSWPAVHGSARLMRILMIVLVAGLIGVRLFQG